MEGGQKLPYAIVNDLSGDGKCSATKHNNQSALKITSKYSLLASRSPGAIPSPLWGLVRNVPMNLGQIILDQSCQNIGNAPWKEHSCRLTFLDLAFAFMRKWRVQFTHLAEGWELRFLKHYLYSSPFLNCVSLFTHLLTFCSPERKVKLALLIRRRNVEVWRSKETCVKVHIWNWQNQIGTQDFKHVLFDHPSASCQILGGEMQVVFCPPPASNPMVPIQCCSIHLAHLFYVLQGMCLHLSWWTHREGAEVPHPVPESLLDLHL